MFLAVLLVGSVSALDFTHTKSYDEKTQTITIKSFPLVGRDITTIKLNTPLNYMVGAGYGKVAELEVNLFDDTYPDAFDKMDFYNAIDMKEIDRQFDYKYLTIELVDVNDYKEVCDPLNKTGCVSNLIGTHQEEREVWKDLDTSVLTKGKITIGIFTEVQVGDYVEWIPTLFGKEIDEWATWTVDLNADLYLYFKFDEVATTIDSVGGLNTSTDASNVTGKIKYAYQYSGSATGAAGYKPYTASINAGSWNAWIKTTDTAFSVFTQDGAGEINNMDTQIGTTYCSVGQFCLNLNRITTVTTAVGNMNDGDWHMITITVDGTTHRMYIDGLNVDNDTTGDNIFGGDSGANGFFMGDASFTGTMDEVGFWDRSLTNEEVTQLYNGGDGITFITDFIPTVVLNSPINNFKTLGSEINFNGTILGHPPLNVSLIIDDTYNETNTSGIITDYLFTKSLSIGSHTWTYEVCSVNSCTNETLRTFNTFSTFVEDGIFYNLISYETAEETFTINITTSGTQTTSAVFYYNDISQGASTKTGTDTTANFSNTIDIPTSTGNREFYWKITVGSEEDSIKTNQTVSITQFGLCNATLTVPYINFTFVDEETTDNLNATIDTSSWEYWLGDGTVTKFLLFSNTTVNDNYAFCFSVSNETMKNIRSVQYASPGYPQRKYDASSDLTNITTNKTLYLLSSSDGIYSTIQVVDQEGDKISDIEVTVERDFVGVPTVVGQETTDDAGLVTFWVNPDYDHRFTFAGDSCTGTTVTIRPTQTQYTQQLQCGVSDDIYVSQIEGIKYARTPATGIIQANTYNFTYQLVSSKDNIVNASFELVNSSDGTVLNSTWSTCTSSGCTLWFEYTVNFGDDIKGKYYLDVGNGSFLLEGDARWRVIDIPTAGKAGFGTFIRDMKYVIDEWGDDSDTADFNRLVIIFFFMCLAISALNYQFGNDTTNPGAFLIIMTFVILMGSIVGGTTGQGFFYFNNLTGTTFINNYILLGFTLVITISYFINVNRQASR